MVIRADQINTKNILVVYFHSLPARLFYFYLIGFCQCKETAKLFLISTTKITLQFHMMRACLKKEIYVKKRNNFSKLLSDGNDGNDDVTFHRSIWLLQKIKKNSVGRRPVCFCRHNRCINVKTTCWPHYFAVNNCSISSVEFRLTPDRRNAIKTEAICFPLIPSVGLSSCN